MAVITQMQMLHERDPKDVIREDVGDISALELFHNQILIGIYQRPDQLKSGLYIPVKTQKEDNFQGIVGLVLKKGPGAFVDDAVNKFYGIDVHEGDWVLFRTSDGHKMSVNGKICRILEDAHIKGRLQHPDQVL